MRILCSMCGVKESSEEDGHGEEEDGVTSVESFLLTFLIFFKIVKKIVLKGKGNH